MCFPFLIIHHLILFFLTILYLIFSTLLVSTFFSLPCFLLQGGVMFFSKMRGVDDKWNTYIACGVCSAASKYVLVLTLIRFIYSSLNLFLTSLITFFVPMSLFTYSFIYLFCVLIYCFNDSFLHLLQQF